VQSWCLALCAPRAAVGFPTNNAPHVLHCSAVGFPTSTAAAGTAACASETCLPGACPRHSRLVGAHLDWLWQQIIVVNCAEPVPSTVCSTRCSRISNQQRGPRAARQCSWIPNQHGCAWERAVFAGDMPLAPTAGWGSVGLALATDSPRVSSSTHKDTHTRTTNHALFYSLSLSHTHTHQ